MPAVQGADDAYALAYDEGKRAIAEQATALKEVRDRTGTVTSAAAVTIGLAAGLAAGAGERVAGLGQVGVAMAAVGFVVLTVCAAVIWWPVDVTFNLDAGVIVGSYAEATPPKTLAAIHRDLALYLGRHAQANRVRIDRRLKAFGIALLGFLVEVAGLLAFLYDIVR
jgi:hypothetical protein